MSSRQNVDPSFERNPAIGEQVADYLANHCGAVAVHFRTAQFLLNSSLSFSCASQFILSDTGRYLKANVIEGDESSEDCYQTRNKRLPVFHSGKFVGSRSKANTYSDANSNANDSKEVSVIAPLDFVAAFHCPIANNMEESYFFNSKKKGTTARSAQHAHQNYSGVRT